MASTIIPLKRGEKPVFLKSEHKSIKILKSQDAVTCWLMIALPLIGFLALHVYPIFWTFKWAFFSYNMQPSETRFIGWDNFVTMFTKDFTYWKAWLNTLQFAGIKMPLEIITSLLLAVMLMNKKVKFQGFFRSMYYLPHVISIVIVGLIFTNLFSYNGFINGLFVNLGFIGENVNWFANKWTAMGMLVVGAIWCSFGINVMYFVAALSNVPEELYESARVDGAGNAMTFFKITIPMIAPVFQTIVLLSILSTLSVNEYIISFTGGAPSGETRTIMSYLTTKFVPGFMTDALPELGYGCAMALVTTIIFGILSFAYQGFSRKMNSIY